MTALLRIALPRYNVVLAIIAGLIAYFTTRDALNAPYQVWVDTSAQTHESLVFVTSLAACSGAVAAGRLYTTGSLLQQPLRTRSSGIALAVIGVGTACAVGVGYFVGFIPLVISTVRTASWGGPSWAPILSSLMMLMLCSMLGVMFGVLLRWIFAVPAAVIVSYLFTTAAAYGGDGWWGVTPVQLLIPQPGQFESPELVTYRIMSMGAIIVALWAVSLAIISFRKSHEAVWTVVPVAALAAIAVLVSIPVVKVPDLFALEQNPPRICSNDLIETCVHAAHEADLASVSESVNRVFAEYGHVPSTFDVVTDRSLVLAQMHANAVPPGAFAIQVGPGTPPSQVTNDLLNELSGFHGCMAAGQAGQPVEGQAMSSAMRSWLDSRTGRQIEVTPDYAPSDWTETAETQVIAAPSGILGDYDVEAVRAAIKENYERIRSCDMPLDEFTNGLK